MEPLEPLPEQYWRDLWKEQIARNREADMVRLGLAVNQKEIEMDVITDAGFLPITELRPSAKPVPFRERPFVSVIKCGPSPVMRMSALAWSALGKPRGISIYINEAGNKVVIRPGNMYCVNPDTRVFSGRPLIRRLGLDLGRYEVDVEEIDGKPTLVMAMENDMALAS